MHSYKCVYTFKDGKVCKESNFDDLGDFEKTITSLRHMIIDGDALLSFQAYIDDECIENSEETEYIVLMRDEHGFPSAVGMNSKRKSQ